MSWWVLCSLPTAGTCSALPCVEEAGLTHPLAEGGEGVQALLILGRVPQLCVITAAALWGERRDPVMGGPTGRRAEVPQAGRVIGACVLINTTAAGGAMQGDTSQSWK